MVTPGPERGWSHSLLATIRRANCLAARWRTSASARRSQASPGRLLLTPLSVLWDPVTGMQLEHSPPVAVSADFRAALAQAEPHLRAVARRLCRDDDAAKDLVQDTFERALNKSDHLQPNSNPRAWLTTIMHRLFIDQCRARARRPPPRSIDELQVAAPPSEVAPWWTKVTVAELRAAAEILDPRFAEVYRLSTFHKMSYAQIAKHLDIQKATVGTRLIRARRKIREILCAKHGHRARK